MNPQAAQAAGVGGQHFEAVVVDELEGSEMLAAHTRRLAANGGCTVRNQPCIVNRLCELLELEL